MTKRPRNDVERLLALLDALHGEILAASDEEICEDLMAAGEDPEEVAARVRALVTEQIRYHRRRRMEAVRQEVALRNTRNRRRLRRIPSDPNEQRAFLGQIMRSRPDVPERLTMAFREGHRLSNDDVRSMLEDLADLGFLDEERDDEP